VKSDAYGCGLDQVVTRLAEAGCRTFFVADLGEGRHVRALAPAAVIYVLGGMMPGTAPTLARAQLRPVINSVAELAEWDAFVIASGWRGGAAVQVDTGMNRLGFTMEEAAALASRIRSQDHGFTLLLSHLACAEQPDHPMNERQIRLFRELRTLFPRVPSSLANSSGIFLGRAAHGDLVRPGVALYGGNPIPGRPNPMRPVVQLQGCILQVRHAKEGETAGYGAQWTALRPSRLAIIGVGYGDGYARAAGAAKGKLAAQVLIGGRPCPLVGRVSMDLMAIDVTDLPEGTPRRGEFATLIGGDLDIDAVAARWGTIGYEVLTNLGRRYHRVYRG
jgi:alanine racemase